MSQDNPVRQGINTVMGVKPVDRDTTITPDLANPTWDQGVTLTYIGATVAQVAVLTGLLAVLDWGFNYLPTAQLPGWAPTAIAAAVFAFITLRSRLFSLLDNTRNNGRYKAVQRPNWAPPGIVFPIVWMSIAVLRVVSACLVWSTLGQTFLSVPLLLFIIHLSVGDTWNTIFTVEGRLGTAVPMVIVGPLLSVALVTYSYYQTLPLAGWIIFPSLVWLTIATVLCFDIWRLNGKEPLYPVVAKAN